jgi:putative endonuclease
MVGGGLDAGPAQLHHQECAGADGEAQARSQRGGAGDRAGPPRHSFTAGRDLGLLNRRPERSEGSGLSVDSWLTHRADLDGMARQLYVYILASKDRQLYTGVTRNLANRLEQHRTNSAASFVSRSQARRLVYFELIGPPRSAIAREKQIKSWTRQKRIDLIESVNPFWDEVVDLLPRDR